MKKITVELDGGYAALRVTDELWEDAQHPDESDKEWDSWMCQALGKFAPVMRCVQFSTDNEYKQPKYVSRGEVELFNDIMDGLTFDGVDNLRDNGNLTVEDVTKEAA